MPDIEIIDYLFLFWIFFTFAVCGIGNLFEAQVKSQKKKTTSKREEGDRWNSSSQPDYYSQQQQYSSQNSSSYHDNSYIQHNTDYSSRQQPSHALYSASNGSQMHSNPLTDPYLASSQGYRSTHGYDAGLSSLSGQRSLEQQGYDQQQGYSSNLHDYDLAGHKPNIGDGVIPTATGFNSDCVEWVNSILYLFFTQTHKYGPIIAESIYRSLNEKLSNIVSSSTEYSDIIIEFSGINSVESTQPELTNIRTETESEKSVSAICKIYNKRVVFNLTIQRATHYSSHDLMGAHSGQIAHYDMILENLEGKLKSMAILNDKLIVIQFMEKPDTKIIFRPKNSLQPTQNLINEDVLVQMILQTLTQVVVDLYFGDDVDFPQYKSNTTQSAYSNYKNKFNNIFKGSATEIKRQIKHDFFGGLSSSDNTKERKVFIKIVRAKNINYNQNVTCLLELDVPHQQAISSTKQGSNPFWDEHFLFNVNEKSLELTLELWDSLNLTVDGNIRRSSMKQQQVVGRNKWHKAELTATGKFLGLVRINVEELRRNPVQRVNLMLQSQQPNSRETNVNSGSLAMSSDLTNSVGGELQLELLFLEHSLQPSASGTLKKSGSSNSIGYQQGDVVSIDRKLTPSGYVITTTTITKPNVKDKQKAAEQLSVGRNQSPIPSLGTEHSEIDINFDGLSSQISDVQPHTGDLENQQQQQQQQPDSQSRGRSRSRSILRAIKKRFSFSRTRSRSVGESGLSEGGHIRGDSAMGATSTNLDTPSLDSRSRASSEVSYGRAKSVPVSRELNEVPTIVINKGRLSDTASAFTFTHPKSQLVIECIEPQLGEDGHNTTSRSKGRVRYYAVPDDAANKRKWRRRGLKLHLFNEHQFVACHLAGSSTCHLCGRVFSRRPGKQGYKCRNCHLLSHKQCHVKVDHNCPYASRDGLKLEYIDADPPANLVEEALRDQMSGTLPRDSGSPVSNQSKTKPMRIGAKSISMEVDDR